MNEGLRRELGVGEGEVLVEGRGMQVEEGQIYFKGGTRYCHAGLNLSAKLEASSRGAAQPCGALKRRC
jgi:hypothetical protein